MLAFLPGECPECEAWSQLPARGSVSSLREDMLFAAHSFQPFSKCGFQFDRLQRPPMAKSDKEDFNFLKVVFPFRIFNKMIGFANDSM